MSQPGPIEDPCPSGRDRTIELLVRAAIERFGADGPDGVSLRDIAAAAGVNYGLIHQYVGTKDDLLRLAIGRVSEESRSRFSTETTEVSIDRLVNTASASPSLRLLAWALLQGHGAEDLVGRSGALLAMAEQLGQSGADGIGGVGGVGGVDEGDEVELRRRTVVMMSLILGWELFGGYLTEAIDLDRSTGPDTAALVRYTARSITRRSSEVVPD